MRLQYFSLYRQASHRGIRASHHFGFLHGLPYNAFTKADHEYCQGYVGMCCQCLSKVMHVLSPLGREAVALPAVRAYLRLWRDSPCEARRAALVACSILRLDREGMAANG